MAERKFSYRKFLNKDTSMMGAVGVRSNVTDRELELYLTLGDCSRTVDFDFSIWAACDKENKEWAQDKKDLLEKIRKIKKAARLIERELEMFEPVYEEEVKKTTKK